MKKRYRFTKTIICGILCILPASGCTAAYNVKEEPQTMETEIEMSENEEKEEAVTEETVSEPAIIEAGWSGYFDGFNGAAVIYDVSAMRYTVYNVDLAQTKSGRS